MAPSARLRRSRRTTLSQVNRPYHVRRAVLSTDLPPKWLQIP
ncbi:hypothetical protein [Scytonema sp. HK-05]|nr:hypothetical protein [Scytonema sp. HK-05]